MAIVFMGATAVAGGALHLYRYYRYLTYGEPMP